MLDLALQIASILAPAACLALIGLGWHRLGPPFPIGFVTTLTVNLGLPALLFHTLVTATVTLEALVGLGLATLAVHALFAPLAIALLRLARKDWRLSVAHVVGNTGNVGLPLCLLAFGEEGLAYAIAFFAVQCVLLFTVGEAIYAGSASVRRAARSPILHAVWLALAVRLLGFEPPAFAMETLRLLGGAVVPLMLITLGVSLAGMRVEALPATLLWAALRTVLAVAIGFGVAAAFGLEGVARGVLVIETTVPVAVFNFLLAEKHGRDSREVSGLILVTHLAAIVYLPLVLGAVLR